MKNGTQSSNGLTLVGNGAAHTLAKTSTQDDALAMRSTRDMEQCPGDPIKDLLQNKALFAVVSVACFAAAVGAGSYAIWLSRRKVAREAFTSVSDLLTTCQNRMVQMENDLKTLSRPRSA